MGGGTMEMSRVWAMPTKDTFDCKPIGEFVRRHMNTDYISIDPFARNKRWATYTNDLNPDTDAEYHMDALAFLDMLVQEGRRAECVIFDPPYSPRQIKECYNGIGLKMHQEDAWRTNGWKPEKDLCNILMPVGSIFLYFGWNTTGMCKSRGFEPIELLVVCHGPGHNDTLCLAEKKVRHQMKMDMGE